MFICEMEKNGGTMWINKNALIIAINEKIHRYELHRDQQ